VITVEFVNQPPVAIAGDDDIIPETDVNYILDGTASNDPDSLDVLTYSWTDPEGVVLDDESSATPGFIVPNVEEDTDFEFVLIVSDQHDRAVSEPDTVVITVLFVNQPPIADAGPDDSVLETEATYTLNGTGSFDPDELDLITFAWTGPLALDDPALASPTFDVPDVTVDTDYEFVLVVDDGYNRVISAPDTVVITVLFVDQPPVADAGLDDFVDEDVDYMLDGTGSYDLDEEPLTYLWTAPAGIVLDDETSATPSFTAPLVDVNTPYEFILVVDNELPVRVASAPDTVVITVLDVPEENRPPVAIAGPDDTVDEEMVYMLDGTASYDPDQDPITYSWTGDLALDDPTLASPSFTAPVVDVDTEYEFVLTVEDNIYDVNLLITGVLDGPLTGGTPKCIELYALNDIADLSIYSFGSANNGNGGGEIEFTVPSRSCYRWNIYLYWQ